MVIEEMTRIVQEYLDGLIKLCEAKQRLKKAGANLYLIHEALGTWK